jgi:hypothetical protein
VGSVDGLQALREYNDWCEEADSFVSKVAVTNGAQLSNIPRELADKTVSSLANEVVRVHWLLAQLLEELETAKASPAVDIKQFVTALEDSYKKLPQHGY